MLVIYPKIPNHQISSETITHPTVVYQPLNKEFPLSYRIIQNTEPCLNRMNSSYSTHGVRLIEHAANIAPAQLH